MNTFNDSEEFLELMDILRALPREQVIVPKHSGYNVGCNDWTGEMIYQKAYSLLAASRPEVWHSKYDEPFEVANERST